MDSVKFVYAKFRPNSRELVRKMVRAYIQLSRISAIEEIQTPEGDTAYRLIVDGHEMTELVEYDSGFKLFQLINDRYQIRLP